MAVKIEKGGWILIFLLGLGLVAYALNKYGLLDIAKLDFQIGSGTFLPAPRSITTKPLDDPCSSETSDVRVRLNIWVGCVAGLVANGGLDTAARLHL